MCVNIIIDVYKIYLSVYKAWIWSVLAENDICPQHKLLLSVFYWLPTSIDWFERMRFRVIIEAY